MTAMFASRSHRAAFSRRFAEKAGVAVIVVLLAFGTAGSIARSETGEASTPEPREAAAQGPTSIGHWTFARLERANAELAEGNYDAAIKSLDQMLAVVEKDRRSKRREKLNAYERAMMWQTYGYVYAGQERYSDAIGAFEKSIAEEGLPLSAELGVRSNLAQIYLGEGEYSKSIENFELWFARSESPTPEAHYMLAMAYALSGDKAGALPHAEQAVEKSDAPQEGRLQLLTSLYFDQGRYEDVEVLLRQLLTHFPKKKYWSQLSAIYAEMGSQDLALAVQEAMFEQHLFTEHREFITLAQLHLHGGLPYEAALVLEAGLDAGIVEDAEEGWDLLASSYLQAQEYTRALDPLERAAALSRSGDGYVRLGEVYLGEERWANARRAFEAALSKGDLEDVGRAQVLLGIAYASDLRFDDAKRAFVSAQKYPDSAEMAKQWIAHVEQQRQLVEDEAMHSKATANGHRDAKGELSRAARGDMDQ